MPNATGMFFFDISKHIYRTQEPKNLSFVIDKWLKRLINDLYFWLYNYDSIVVKVHLSLETNSLFFAFYIASGSWHVAAPMGQFNFKRDEGYNSWYWSALDPQLDRSGGILYPPPNKKCTICICACLQGKIPLPYTITMNVMQHCALQNTSLHVQLFQNGLESTIKVSKAAMC